MCAGFGLVLENLLEFLESLLEFLGNHRIPGESAGIRTESTEFLGNLLEFLENLLKFLQNPQNSCRILWIPTPWMCRKGRKELFGFFTKSLWPHGWGNSLGKEIFSFQLTEKSQKDPQKEIPQNEK